MKQAIEHDQFDAIVMSLSAIALMANTRYDIWRAYAERHARGEVDLKQNIDRDSEAIRKLCSLLDEAMQYIGEVNNRTDAVDDHGMTDAAFEAMDRALERQEATT